MTVSSGPDGTINGLVYCIDAGNRKSYPGSGTDAVDLIGGVSSILTNGPSFSTDGVGSWSFDGSNDYLAINNSSRKFQWTPSGAGSNTLTFEMWVKTSDSNGFFVSKPWNGNGEYNYYITNTGFQAGNNSGYFNLSYSQFATGNWEHGVFIITPTQITIYRNGVLNAGPSNHSLTVNTPTYGDFNDTHPLTIMSLYPYGSGWGGNTGFSILGSVGLLKVYNRVLTATEVLRNYNATKSRFGV